MGLQNATAGAYLKLYLLTARSDSGGLLCNGRKVFDKDDLAWYLRSDVQGIEPFLEELTTTGLMRFEQGCYWITHFMEEQGPGENEEREKWKERQRNHRARVIESDLEADGEKEKDKEKKKEEDLEREEESHGDVTVTPTLSPECDFGDYTSERERLIRGFCRLLQFSPPTIEDFVKEHMPTACFESRLERDYSKNNEFTRDVAGQIARILSGTQEKIFEINRQNLTQTYFSTFQESPTDQDAEYLEDKARVKLSLGLWELPVALSKTKCQEICDVL
jgi:hypothetical protein